jgi:nitroreductase
MTNSLALEKTTAAMGVRAAILRRRAVRHYRKDPVPSTVLNDLIDLALEAPSSWNLQDRHLVVVRSKAGLAALTEATGGQPQPQEAPVMIVFLADIAAHTRDRGHIWQTAKESGAWSHEFIAFFSAASQEFQEGLTKRGALREYAVKDAMIAASFFILAAQESGLATSPMNGWDETLVKRAVGVEERNDLAVALLVSLGYAAEMPKHPGRQKRSLSVFAEQFGESFRG